jgi:hypothetical protein
MIVFLKKYKTTTFNSLHYHSLSKNFTDRFTYENRPSVNLSSVKKTPMVLQKENTRQKKITPFNIPIK